ncbi:DMT family transporter [Fusobacterium nucleatum]|uniref:DMT family transporter n=1 Tax=Fusobacterium nucleatum TaxID=851 RepID=UPI0030CE3689
MEIKKTKEYLLLFFLAFIWSSTFIFLKKISPFFGIFGSATIRLLTGSISLLIIYKSMKWKIRWKLHWKFLFVIGMFNAAIPFSLFAFASKYIPSSFSAILNSFTPFFGIIFALIILKKTVKKFEILGIALGIAGIFLIGTDRVNITSEYYYFGIFAVILATMFYGIAANLIKKYTKDIKSWELACGSQLFAGIALIPLTLYEQKFNFNIPLSIIGMAIVFGFLCSGLAYVIYYRLVFTLGAISSLTVTFLIPIFSVIWGVVLMKEIINIKIIIGTILILLGTFLLSFNNENNN